MNFNVSENLVFWTEVAAFYCKRRAEHSYISRFCWPTSLLFGAPGLYWDPNAAKKEGKRRQEFPAPPYLDLHFSQNFFYTSYDVLSGDPPNRNTTNEEKHLLNNNTLIQPYSASTSHLHDSLHRECCHSDLFCR